MNYLRLKAVPSNKIRRQEGTLQIKVISKRKSSKSTLLKMSFYDGFKQG